MNIALVVLTRGRSSGKSIPIAQLPFFLGRHASCQLRLTSDLVSRRHCVLRSQEGKVFVEDLDSSNGTYVNDRQIKGAIELLDGDVLKIGPLFFGVLLLASPASKAHSPPKYAGMSAAGSVCESLESADQNRGRKGFFDARELGTPPSTAEVLAEATPPLSAPEQNTESIKSQLAPQVSRPPHAEE